MSAGFAWPKPEKRTPKPRKPLRRDPKCECGHTKEVHDCTKRGHCARCIWPSCGAFREKRPTRRPMRRKAPRRLKKQSPADRRYLKWLHTQVCVGVEAFPRHECLGEIQAAHFRDMTGLGRKSADTTCIPMCQSLHGDYDQARGWFYGTTKEDRKLFHVSQQLKMRVRYELEELRREGML